MGSGLGAALEALIDQIDDVLDGPERLQIRFAEGEPRLLLDAHGEIDGVDAVEVEIVDQVGGGAKLLIAEMELRFPSGR